MRSIADPMILKLHPDAEEDFKEARELYAGIDQVLEKRFIQRLDETFDRIVKFPNLYPFESDTAQKILMNLLNHPPNQHFATIPPKKQDTP